MSTDAVGGVIAELERCTRDFIEACGTDVIGVVITRNDGLVIYHYVPRGLSADPRAIAAMVSLTMGSSRRAYRQLMQGEPEELIMGGTNGKIIVKTLKIGEREVYISVLTNAEPNLGLVLFELDNYAKKVRDILVR